MPWYTWWWFNGEAAGDGRVGHRHDASPVTAMLVGIIRRSHCRVSLRRLTATAPQLLRHKHFGQHKWNLLYLMVDVCGLLRLSLTFWMFTTCNSSPGASPWCYHLQMALQCDGTGIRGRMASPVAPLPQPNSAYGQQWSRLSLLIKMRGMSSDYDGSRLNSRDQRNSVPLWIYSVKLGRTSVSRLAL